MSEETKNDIIRTRNGKYLVVSLGDIRLDHSQIDGEAELSGSRVAMEKLYHILKREFGP